MELVAPAGNLEKLHYAYLFGADAVYIGIKNFSLRAQADNFQGGEFHQIPGLKKDKKLYCVLNIFFTDQDIEILKNELAYLKNYACDAFIISDIGIVPVLRSYFPHTPLHLSTQANCTNTEAAMRYKDMGFSRIIPARELSLKEIERIKSRVGIEIEVFVHGAMCLAYSGRCFLSAYMAGRAANKGDCAHSCRWQYRVLEEEERPGEYFPVVQGENFTSILSSKDMCLIGHLKELKDAGVDAVKIEGRMKSVYYTAVVTRAYRKAIDKLLYKTAEDINPYLADLEKVSHREYWTGFFFDSREIQKPTQSSYIRPYAFLGIIGEEREPGCFRLQLKNQLVQGDLIEYIGNEVCFIPDKDFAIFTAEGQPVLKADHGKDYLLKTDKKIGTGYLIRKKIV